MTKLLKYTALSAIILIGSAGQATAQNSDYTAAQQQQLIVFKSNIQSGSLDADKVKMIDCAGFFAHVQQTLPTLTDDPEAKETADNVAEAYETAAILTARKMDSSEYVTDETKAYIGMQRSQYAVRFPGQKILNADSSAILKSCGTYKAVNDYLILNQ